MSIIFPPVLQSTQTAFLASSNSYRVYFSLSTVNSLSNIGHIEISIVRQANNKSIVKTSGSTHGGPDGILYYNQSEATKDSASDLYYIDVSTDDLIEGWTPGYLYKVQVRFGKNPRWTNIRFFTAWRNEQLTDIDAYSEWSTVLIIKAINSPTVGLTSNKKVSIRSTVLYNSEPSLNPTFIGSYLDNGSDELEDSYKFDLYKGDAAGETPIDSSGWKIHTAEQDAYRFSIFLDNYTDYTVTYSVRTVNGFEISDAENTAQLPFYTFTTELTYFSNLEGVALTAIDNTPFCHENGVIDLYINSIDKLSGDYAISRASEKTNFRVYEDVKRFTLFNQEAEEFLAYRDFIVESGIRYRYAIQRVWQGSEDMEFRTNPVYSSDASSSSIDFEHSYLYRDGVQLKLQLNTNISSFKHTVLRAKQDTVGGKYPHLVQNGYAYYAEFPISGIISFQTDEDQQFFALRSEGFYYRDELVIPREKFDIEQLARTPSNSAIGSNYDSLSISTDPTYNNIFVERIFREKAEEFLNGFDYKLFKSPTEGNIIVSLFNVSLTPIDGLGRMIYQFSATAYEMAENTFDNLEKFGITNVGEYSTTAPNRITISFGQVAWDLGGRGGRAFYDRWAGADRYRTQDNDNIMRLIAKQEEVPFGEKYVYKLERVTELQIQPYPSDIDFTPELLDLEARKAELSHDAEANEEEIGKINKAIQEYENLQKVIAGAGLGATLYLDGKQIYIRYGQPYYLDQPISTIAITHAGSPIMINYKCELSAQEGAAVSTISTLEETRVWGQIAGIFTQNKEVLEQYNFNYADSETYRIYNPPSGEETNLNVYSTTNLLDIIKQEARRCVEQDRNIAFHELDNGMVVSEDGKIYCSYVDTLSFDIEADPGTSLRIGVNADGADAKNIQIGPTGKYTLSPSDSLIKYIALERKLSSGEIASRPQFAVVNYKCITNQVTMT